MRYLFLSIFMFVCTACTHSKYTQMPSVNYGDRVKIVVIHYTAVNYAESRRILVEPEGLSAHYLLPERNDATYIGSPQIYQLVNEMHRAWHAGHSYWQGRTNLNDSSIGIELVNAPVCNWLDNVPMAEQEADASKYCQFPKFDEVQIDLLIELLTDIKERYPDIPPTAFVGHSDIGFMRKTDPGPEFPWYKLYLAGIGAWYEETDKEKYWVLTTESPMPAYLFQRALAIYGYGVKETGMWDEQTQRATRAFNLHFLQHKPVTVLEPDSESQATLLALISRYHPELSETLLKDYQSYIDNPADYTPLNICNCDKTN